MDEDIVTLANGLQHSNEPAVAQLAKAFLELNQRYEIVHGRFMELVREQIMDSHETLLQKLED